MGMSMQTRDPPSSIGLPLILSTILLVAVVNVCELGGWNTPMLRGDLVDADSYLRLVRVLELRMGSPWFEDLTTRLAPPEGLVIQWTRPLDILLLLPSLALEWLTGLGPREALFIVGIAIAPAMHVGAALAAAWGAQAIWPGRGAWYAALLMVGSPAAATYSALGRPDHHALIILLLTIGIGATLRAVLPAGRRRWAVAAGVAFGLGVWVGPEALIVAAPALLAIGLAAVIASDGQAAAAQGRRACLAMAATYLLAILVEHRPAEWLVAEYDRISIQQLCFALLAAAVFAVAGAVAKAPRGRRLVVVGAAAVVAAVALVAAFPGVLRGPLANADEAYLRLFHPIIQENLALPPFGPGSFRDITSYVGGVLVAGLLAIGLALPRWLRDGTWPAAVVLLVTMLAALAGTMGARRFGMDLVPPAAIAGAGIFGLLLHAEWPRSIAMRTAAAMAVLLVTLALPFLSLMSGASAAAGTPAQTSRQPCDWTTMTRWLNAERPLAGLNSAAPTLMASDIFEGPRLVWGTPYHVIATPHHRAGAAIEDTIDVFLATDPETSRAILLRRHVSLLLACPDGPGLDTPPGSLIERIRDGRQPDWLAPIALPAALSRFHLFAVQ